MRSGIFGSFDVDLQDDGGDGRWTLLGFSGIEGFDIEARMTAFADVDLDGELKLGSGASFPSVTTTFHYDQIFAEASLSSANGVSANFGAPPSIWLENVSLDLGEFITNFAKPILEQLQVVTEPLEPIIELLTTPIPVISDLGPAPVTLLDLAETFGGKKFDRRYIDAVIAIVEVINSLPTDGSSIMIGFGDFIIMDGSSTNDLRDPANSLSNSDTTQNDAAYKAAGGVEGQLNNPSGRDKNGNTSSTPANKKSKSFISKFGALEGLQIPLLTQPSAIFGLLAGRVTDLFIYDMPPLVASFEYVKSFPIPGLPGLNARLGGNATFTIDVGFGFDTHGFLQFQSSNNAIDIFDGFYLADRDLAGNERPEFSGQLEIFAGASLGIGGIIEAGVEGGLFSGINFDLHDTPTTEFPTGDGKIRAGEVLDRIAMGPICLFDTSGDLGVFLRAFLEIKIPLGFTDVTIFDKDFELFRKTLASFNHICVPEPPPAFARLSNGTLTLNMGPDSQRRATDAGLNPATTGHDIVDSHPSDNDRGEDFKVIKIVDNGVDYYQVYFNGRPDQELDPADPTGELRRNRLFLAADVDTIVANGGAGHDVIEIGEDVNADLIINGGADNDTIIIGKPDATRTVTIHGDAGHDEITGHNGDETIYGDAGNDLIRGGGGNDTIYGGASVAMPPVAMIEFSVRPATT